MPGLVTTWLASMSHLYPKGSQIWISEVTNHQYSGFLTFTIPIQVLGWVVKPVGYETHFHIIFCLLDNQFVTIKDLPVGCLAVTGFQIVSLLMSENHERSIIFIC